MSIFSKIFSKSKNQGELVLVFDIGSSSVGGALFYMQETGAPKIIYSTREPISLEKELNIDNFFSLTIKALKVVAGKVCMKGGGAPNRIFCTLSSPWCASQIRTIEYERNTPFIFTSKFADELIQKELAIFNNEHSIKEGGENKIRPIEMKNMQTILNGYPTVSPYNQKAEKLEMTLFISMGEEEILKKIEDTIHIHFHNKTIKFSSLVMSSFTVARDMFVNQKNFLLINIGGEITDISMIKKDSIQESVSYPIGRNFVMRELTYKLKCSIDEATSYLSLYKDGHMSDAHLRKIEPIIDNIKAEWLDKFQVSLSTLTNDISIPATIFITVDQDVVDFFSEIIKTEQFNQYTLTESKFRVIFLGTEALHGIVSFADDHIPHDSFLIIESIYINHFLR